MTTTQHGLEFCILSTPSDLIDLKSQWNGLWSDIPDRSIFSAPDWLLTWLSVYWKENWKLATLAGFQDEKLRILAPMYIQPGRKFSRPSIAFPLGQGESEAMEISTEYLEFLVAPGFEAVATSKIRNWLEQFDADLLCWRALHADGFTAKLLSRLDNVECSRGLSYRVDATSWSIASLGKSTSSRWRRIQSQISRKNGRFRWLQGHEQEEFWPSLAKFHQRRWQARGKSGAFYAEEFSSFHKSYRQLSDYSTSRMSCLMIDDKPVAINYYLLGEDTLYFYQSGWDADYAKLSPGLALHLWSMQNADQKYYDFMLGSVENNYKKIFKCEEREMTNIEVLRRPVIVMLAKLWGKLQRVFRSGA